MLARPANYNRPVRGGFLYPYLYTCGKLIVKLHAKVLVILHVFV